MPLPPVITGAAVSLVPLESGSVALVELWDGGGSCGIAAHAGDPIEPLVECCHRAVGSPVSRGLIEPDRWATDWLEPGASWWAQGAVETARADLDARLRGLPLWLALGGAARTSVRADSDFLGEVSGEAVADRIDGWPALARRILDRSVDVVRVAPVGLGGPASVARLDAVARTFQLELQIVAETPLVLSRSLAVHLTVTLRAATLPPVGASEPVAVPWLTPARADLDLAVPPLPDGPGLGVTLDRELLARVAARRVVIGS